MFALQKRSSTAWDLSVAEVQVPRLGAGEVLLQPQAVGLCGSDVHAARSDEGYEWLQPPLTLGHEVTGVIVEATPEHCDLIGRRAVVIAIDGCGTCEVCKSGATNYCVTRNCIGIHTDGGLARYLAIAASRLYLIPDDCGLEPSLAALIEPAAIAIQATKRLGLEFLGTSVGVSGPGAIGLFSGLALLDAGAEVFMYGPPEGAESRVAFAAELGMQIGSVDDGFAADAWVEASGSSSALNAGLERLKLRAKIVVPAMFPNISGVAMNQIVRKGLTLLGTYGYVHEDYEAAHQLIHNHQHELSRMITVFGFNDAVEALQRTSRAELIKAVVVQKENQNQ